MAVIFIKDPSLWTLSSGLMAEGGRISLARYEDMFGGFTLDSGNIGAVTAGNGTLTMRGGMFVYSPETSDAALWYMKAALDTAIAESYTVRFNITDIGTSGWPFMVKQGASAPVINAAPPVIDLAQHATDLWALRYRKADGSFMYWNHSLAQWQAASVTMMGIDYTHAYEVVFTQGSGQWQMTLTDLTSGLMLTSTTAVAWAETYDSGDPYYICGGDYATTGSAITMTVFALWKNYPLTPETATMGQMDFNDYFDTFPITHSVEAGASVTWQYNRDGAGWVTPGAGAPPDIEDALGGLFINTLDLRATLLSDATGSASAGFEMGHGVLGGRRASFNLPLEAVDINITEVVEL